MLTIASKMQNLIAFLPLLLLLASVLILRIIWAANLQIAKVKWLMRRFYCMATYRVRINIPTDWEITIAANSEEEAIKKALEADAPAQLAYQDDDEWPHVKGMTIDAEIEE